MEYLLALISAVKSPGGIAACVAAGTIIVYWLSNPANGSRPPFLATMTSNTLLIFMPYAVLSLLRPDVLPQWLAPKLIPPLVIFLLLFAWQLFISYKTRVDTQHALNALLDGVEGQSCIPRPLLKNLVRRLVESDHVLHDEAKVAARNLAILLIKEATGQAPAADQLRIPPRQRRWLTAHYVAVGFLTVLVYTWAMLLALPDFTSNRASVPVSRAGTGGFQQATPGMDHAPASDTGTHLRSRNP